jgi:Tfp pilus assembly protein PilO
MYWYEATANFRTGLFRASIYESEDSDKPIIAAISQRDFFIVFRGYDNFDKPKCYYSGNVHHYLVPCEEFTKVLDENWNIFSVLNTNCHYEGGDLVFYGDVCSDTKTLAILIYTIPYIYPEFAGDALKTIEKYADPDMLSIMKKAISKVRNISGDVTTQDSLFYLLDVYTRITHKNFDGDVDKAIKRSFYRSIGRSAMLAKVKEQRGQLRNDFKEIYRILYNPKELLKEVIEHNFDMEAFRNYCINRFDEFAKEHDNDKEYEELIISVDESCIITGEYNDPKYYARLISERLSTFDTINHNETIVVDSRAVMVDIKAIRKAYEILSGGKYDYNDIAGYTRNLYNLLNRYGKCLLDLTANKEVLLNDQRKRKIK